MQGLCARIACRLGVMALLLGQWAYALEPGQTLPGLDAKVREIKVNSGEASTESSSLGVLQGRLYTLYHFAPRRGINKLHQPFLDALETADFPAEGHQIISIANLDEAVWGASGIVTSKFKDNALAKPTNRFILDDGSVLREAWGLAEKSAAIIILDAQGKILTVKEGSVTTDEVASLMSLITDRL